MKIYVVANLDQDWGIEIYSLHLTKEGAEAKLSKVDKHNRPYTEIYEHQVEK